RHPEGSSRYRISSPRDPGGSSRYRLSSPPVTRQGPRTTDFRPGATRRAPPASPGPARSRSPGAPPRDLTSPIPDGRPERARLVEADVREARAPHQLIHLAPREPALEL